VRDEALKKIITLKLGKIQKRIHENHKIHLVCDGALIDEIARRCTEVESGRTQRGQHSHQHIAAGDLAPVAEPDRAEGQKLESIRVDVGADGSFVYS